MPLLFAHEQSELWEKAQTSVLPDDGGHVVFTGTVRAQNKSKRVSHLFYEAYEALAIAQFAELEAKAKKLFGISESLGVHRLGRSEVGQTAVFIKASAPHRREAFLAARFLIDELKNTVAVWKQEYYEDGTSAWDQGLCQCVEIYDEVLDRALEPVRKSLSAAGADYERLRNARVLIVGGGGLGCPLAINLAGLGLGNLSIFDGDKVEEGNLARQFIFARKDLGQSKAELLRHFLAERFLWTKVTAHNEFIGLKKATSLIDSFDLVIDGSDCMKTKAMLAEVSRKAQVAFICASVYGEEGEIALVNPRTLGGCFLCFRKSLFEPPSCGQSGVLTHACAMVAAHASAKAQALLTGQAIASQMVIINSQSHNHQKIALLRDPDCRACGTTASNLLRVRT